MTIFEIDIDVSLADPRDRSRRLYQQLKAAILGGRLKPGVRLPATRKSAAVFGISRNTVVGVYDQLLDEGYLVARHGSGTFVADRAPAADRLKAPPPQTLDTRLNPFWSRPDVTSAFGYFQDRPGASDGAPPDPDSVDFRPGLVDLKHFPFDILRQVSVQKLRALERSPVNYGNPQGAHDLRAAISTHLSVMRAVACQPDDLLVTSGAQQAYDLLARVLVAPGKTVVAVEDPGYAPMRVPFAAAGAKLVPIEVDAEGMVIEKLPPETNLICVSPSHQFPLGATLSKSRRAALIQFAREHGALIIEDDYDGEFRAEGGPIEALKTSDDAGVVFYVGTFSKSILPNIRLGFIMAPPWATRALVTAKVCIDGPCPLPVQSAICGFIAGGHLTRHVSKMRQIYGERRQLVLSLLRERFSAWLEPVNSPYGMHVTAISNGTVDIDAAAASLWAGNIRIRNLRRYYVGEPLKSGLVFGLGMMDLAAIERAMGRIHQTLREF